MTRATTATLRNETQQEHLVVELTKDRKRQKQDQHVKIYDSIVQWR